MADPRQPPDPGLDSGSGSGAPTDSGDPDESTEHSLGDVVAIARDIVLYAPIALVLDAPTLLPKLAEQGKQHMRNARALGPHALRRIQNRLASTAGAVGEQAAELLRQFGAVVEPGGDAGGRVAGTATRPGSARSAGQAGAASSSAASAATGAARRDGHTADGSENGRGPVASPSPAVDELAIPDYDSLSALQVVDRLPGLSADELEAVRSYEATHRGRKTILNKAAQLQA